METYQKILAFLKDYVIYHFRDEEAYQESVHYNGLAATRRTPAVYSDGAQL